MSSPLIEDARQHYPITQRAFAHLGKALREALSKVKTLAHGGCIIATGWWHEAGKGP